MTRRTAVDFGVPLLTNAQLFKMFVESLRKHKEGKVQFTQVRFLESVCMYVCMYTIVYTLNVCIYMFVSMYVCMYLCIWRS